MSLSRGKKWLLGTAGVCVSLTGLFMWLNRAPSLPQFVLDHRYEVVHEYIAGTYKRVAADMQAVNIRLSSETLIREVQRIGPSTITPVRPYHGYYISFLDRNCPIMSVELRQGRYAWCKSFYYYDHNQPKEFSDGWTAVDITYRPNLHSKAVSYWDEVIAPRLGIKPKESQGVLAIEGLVSEN